MSTPKELKTLETQWKRAFNAIAKARRADPRTFKNSTNAGAYLTPDMLRQRQKLTRGGRQDLVLKYGHGDKSVSFTLRDLNDMAARIERAKGVFKHEVRGIPARDVIAHSMAADVARAKVIRTSTLFKLTGNMLSFRVSASGDTQTAPSYYQVRIRLEDWSNAITRGEGGKYMISAKQATTGRISFDCNCERYRYWFHYLASIGGFDIEPHENAFPKIRNPRLKGCACKHVLKTLLALNTTTVQTKIASAMQTMAQGKGFTEMKRGKFIDNRDLSKFEASGSLVAERRAFNRFLASTKAFMTKQREPQVRQMQRAYLKRTEKAMEKKNAQIKTLQEGVKKQVIGRLRDLSVTGKSVGKSFEEILDMQIKNNPDFQFSKDQALEIAKEEGII